MNQPLSDMATVAIDRPFAACFAFLADPHKLGAWAKGIEQPRVVEPDSVVGRYYGGEECWARIEADAQRGSIRYHLGADPSTLVPRIMIQVVAGGLLGRSRETCLVSMMAWRTAAMDDRAWKRLVSGHAAEITLIKQLIEAEPDRA